MTKKKKKNKKIKKEMNPSSEILDIEKKLPDIYRPREGLGFFGYIFLEMELIFYNLEEDLHHIYTQLFDQSFFLWLFLSFSPVGL